MTERDAILAMVAAHGDDTLYTDAYGPWEGPVPGHVLRVEAETFDDPEDRFAYLRDGPRGSGVYMTGGLDADRAVCTAWPMGGDE